MVYSFYDVMPGGGPSPGSVRPDAAAADRLSRATARGERMQALRCGHLWAETYDRLWRDESPAVREAVAQYGLFSAASEAALIADDSEPVRVAMAASPGLSWSATEALCAHASATVAMVALRHSTKLRFGWPRSRPILEVLANHAHARVREATSALVARQDDEAWASPEPCVAAGDGGADGPAQTEPDHPSLAAFLEDRGWDEEDVYLAFVAAPHAPEQAVRVAAERLAERTELAWRIGSHLRDRALHPVAAGVFSRSRWHRIRILPRFY